METVIICLDSFKESYLKETPFLNYLTKRNAHGKLKSLYGYTSIYGAAITGRHPIDTDIWSEVAFTDKSFFWWSLPLQIFEKTFFEKWVRFFLSGLFMMYRFIKNQGYYNSVKRIPFKYLPYVQPSMTYAWCQTKSLPVPTIFDDFRRRDLSFYYHEWPSIYKNEKRQLPMGHKNNDEDKIRDLQDNLVDFDVFWCHLWDLDKIVHKTGCNSLATKTLLKNLDTDLKNLFYEIGKSGKFKFLLWSDHGMSDVQRHVDVVAKLKDYVGVYFVDSTSIRFKNVNSANEKLIRSCLNGVDGFFLTTKIKEKYHLGSLKKYGNLIFKAKSGVCFTPNFYDDRAVKAMHGYDPNLPDQKGYYITNMDTVCRERCVTDIPNLIRNSLDN